MDFNLKTKDVLELNCIAFVLDDVRNPNVEKYAHLAAVVLRREILYHLTAK